MQIIRPIIHETLWGGQRLAAVAGTDGSRRIGHLYSLISNGEFESEIMAGPGCGGLFRDYFAASRQRLGLGHCARLPFVLALVDAAADLSLQVHPDDEAAAELEGLAQGKHEAWYFLEAPESGWIYSGCQAADREELARGIREGSVPGLCGRLQVSCGDYVYVEAGTLHALTAGSLVYEIEENCPATYRLHDFGRLDGHGRPRPLHIASALRALHIGRRSRVRRYGAGGIRERGFVTRLVHGGLYRNASPTMECLTFLSGTAELDGCRVQAGITVVLEPGESTDCRSCEVMAARPVLPEEGR